MISQQAIIKRKFYALKKKKKKKKRPTSEDSTFITTYQAGQKQKKEKKVTCLAVSQETIVCHELYLKKTKKKRIKLHFKQVKSQGLVASYEILALHLKKEKKKSTP